MRQRNLENSRIETEEQRRERLENMRETSRRNRFLGENNFLSAINEFADVPCGICRKLLYPKQRCYLDTSCRQDLLPSELVEMNNIVTCSRCSTSVRKRKVPSKAYWNKMDVTPIPPEIASLSDVEQRLLTRIIPFLKIIKVQNRFSQNWCKGQVVLFAQDVVEIAEQLPLPLCNAGLVVVVETRENLQQHREFNLNIERVKTALQWLLLHNNLYQDVIPNFASILDNDISQIFQVAEFHDDDSNGNQVQTDRAQQITVQQIQSNQPSRLVHINNDVSILRGSFHQGNDRFSIDSRGRQCTGIAATASVAFSLSDANTWTVSDVDYILIVGDTYYHECILARQNPNAGEQNVEYLALRELLPRLLFNGHWVNVNVQNNVSIDGHIDKDQSEEGFPNLKNALACFFRDHQCGILTSNSVSVAIACQSISGNTYYWLFDSHARGPKGYKASSRGTACCMRFVNIDELFAILRRNLKVNKGDDRFFNTYCITPISICIDENQAEQVVASQASHHESLHDPPCNNLDAPSVVEYVVTQESFIFGCSPQGPVNISPVDTFQDTPISIGTDKREAVQEVASHSSPVVEHDVIQESLVYTCSFQGPIPVSSDDTTTTHENQVIQQCPDTSQDIVLPPYPIPSVSNNSTTPITHLRLHTTNLEKRVICSTSLLYSIDEDVPTLDTIVNANNGHNLDDPLRVVDVQRKTAPPLNIEREKRMEELCWYFLYPDGRNGFGEDRDISITALDYFQARIMSNDPRFQRNDYLFFALSVVEYFRAKASVSVSCRMKQGEHTPQGLVDNMHLTMRNIRGSAAYWKRCCSELIAMVRSLGPPTWFVTFSCNDLNWPDMIKALLIADGRPDAMPDAVEDIPFDERLELVQKYPVVVARQFTLRVNALMRFLKMNADCLGGSITDFWHRIEFQNRGSPHLHMLLWCNTVPDFDSPEGLRIIDQVVSCSLNGDNTELVKRLQIHKHSTTCYKDRNTGVCRFGFPRPTSDTTTCLEPDDALRNNGRFCILQRNADEVMVNNYNTVLLKIWGANMDIQPCGNVTAVAYYIAKYASKCEPSDCGDVVREAVQKAKRQSNDVWKQLFSVSMAILGQRLVSAPEAAYRLCHLPLKMCSRKTVFVNSCRPEQRYRLLRFGEDETSIFNNIFDRYQQRPNELEEVSLAEFSVRYETVSSTVWTDDDGDIELRDQENEHPRYIKLLDQTRMRIRNQAAVLRTRYYTLNSDREGFFYNLVVCHIPFRNESELMEEGETAEACFLRRQSELRPLLHNLSVEQFAHAEQIIQQALVQAVALNTVNDDRSTNDPREHNINIYAEDQINVYADQDDFIDNNDSTAMPDEVFVNGIRSLNVQQKDLLKQVSDSIDKDIRLDENQQPLLLFITGGAGSGKSFILKLIVEHIKRCYAPTVDVLLKPNFVEVASLTGVAARQISGRTLHSVFSLPIEKTTTMTYRKMSGQPLERERRKWRYIKWLVIDEISMVSYENLRIIHLRLQEFKNNHLLFGGVNVLLFGDIMQLPPVKGHWCFDQPLWSNAEIHLWQQFSFCELTINMRQSSDEEFVDLLNNLRFGELTISQLQLLCERRRVEQVGDFADGAAVRIFPTIRLVDEYNCKMTDQLLQSSRVYTMHAADESREAATYGKRPPCNVIPADVNNCGGLLHVLKLGKGSRVMLRRNISVTEGLVNGAMGIICKFKWPALRRDQLEAGELPDAVYVKFDDETIGIKVKDSEGLVAIAPSTATFQANKGYGDVERRMLPLILSWAVTVHKLQGTTLNKAVIDLGKKNFAKGQVYVALSRVKTLEGIALCDLEPRKLLTRPHDEKALREMERLRRLKEVI
ncbi:hypothetical protein JYU34_017689 [Plutella xylostella]|uniref:ATP-dependent DNA helicase n=1 Tax=Plutella xylostella TaxID=51655 RepID=A0ABQ7Q1X9_PLUXY|nr:hypothetical protein JYU34_017689 [Plutella xylostella]